MAKKVRVAILNVTGYAGVELARLLYQHPQAEIAAVTGRSEAGKPLGSVFPTLDDLGLTITAELSRSAGVDFVFSALPHKASAEALLPCLRQGLRAVDISADFRLRDAAEYQQWYQVAHPAPELLKDAAYGLTELNKDAIRRAQVVANPGCYPTSAILALAPALKEGLIEPDIIVDSKSGVSGAGRGLGLGTHFSEVNETVSAYGLEGHRHLPEIAQELRRLAPEAKLKVTFVPHLIPMTRGILSTCYAPLVESRLGSGAASAQRELAALYRDFYRDEPFVRVVPAPPQTKQTSGSNYCVLYPAVDPRTGRLIVVSCLDNLVKGAAGQAVQNMNVMLGFEETMGLRGLGLWP
ncbi:MAG: N-acetyl-gamma-glutamyl-phosphate reductase [Chloroflexi bacterium]|nr:N-acetyl-gamma-glutamyl-phosphate reductase [Chloroflexota bacterium]